ncbi:MAG TPA: GNAT family N-acetyltransferase [Leptospiraceae bacterium]|nr:GNAT family N-acetyltransferase [Spirochaetaceae bacterium]HBS06649.1 GNAT family N-acetyltransferase [Leptospiraceae bacterium]|tara:strand:- start:6025 stop:6456 length:432 start_codon:yes stop_codon:yes gene_type:complete
MDRPLEIEILKDPSHELQEDLWQRLHEASVARLQPSDPQQTHSLAMVAKRGHEIRAGLLALAYFGGMNLQCLWVHEEERGNGLASRLLEAIESRSRELGCNIIWGHTFGFEARGFYLKKGYVEFAALPEYPPGYGCSFMKKNL